MITVSMRCVCDHCGKTEKRTFTASGPDGVREKVENEYYPLPDGWIAVGGKGWQIYCSNECEVAVNGPRTGVWIA